VLGFLKTKRDRGKIRRDCRSRWSPRSGDGSDAQVNFWEAPGVASRAEKMSIGK